MIGGVCRKFFTLHFLSIVLIGVLAGCTNTFEKTSLKTTDYEVKLGKSKFSFEGKGSSAGFMLMSAMGPVGIAVGVAIDEGISKEITQSALDVKETSEFQTLIKSYVDQAINKTSLLNKKDSSPFIQIIQAIESSKKPVIFEFKEIGFATVRGNQEQVMAKIHLVINLNDDFIELNFPGSIPDSKALPTANFEQIKKDGATVEQVWVDSFQILLAHNLEKINTLNQE